MQADKRKPLTDECRWGMKSPGKPTTLRPKPMLENDRSKAYPFFGYSFYSISKIVSTNAQWWYDAMVTVETVNFIEEQLQ